MRLPFDLYSDEICVIYRAWKALALQNVTASDFPYQEEGETSLLGYGVGPRGLTVSETGL